MLRLLKSPITRHGFPCALKSFGQEKDSAGGLYTEIIFIYSVSTCKSSKLPREISLLPMIENLSLAKIALPWMGFCFCIIRVIPGIDRHRVR